MKKKILSWVPVLIMVIVFVVFILNFQVSVVISGSMEPTIKTGEMILVKKHNNEYKVGDIISFSEGENTIPVAHRIIEYNSNENYFTTKGDNNNVTDEFKVTNKDIIGKVVFHNYILGILFLKYKIYIIALLIAMAIISLFISGNKEKNKTE